MTEKECAEAIKNVCDWLREHDDKDETARDWCYDLLDAADVNDYSGCPLCCG